MNAVKHGLLATQVVLPDENPEEYETLRSDIREALQPVGAFEETLVESIATQAWRLQRLVRAERGILIQYTFQRLDEIYEEKEQERDEGECLFVDLLRQAVEFRGEEIGPKTDEAVASAIKLIEDEEREFLASQKPREAAKAARNGPDGILGDAFVADAAGFDALGKLSRYEAQIQRSMHRSLNELQRLQVQRRGCAPAEGAFAAFA